MPRVLAALSVLVAAPVFANASGAVGYTNSPPNNDTCNSCHSGGTAPTVQITGPSSVGAGASATYTLTASGGSRYGFDIAVSDNANAKLNGVSAGIGAAFNELYQSSPSSANSWQFTLSAPPFAGNIKLYATVNAVNGNGNTSGDRSASTSFDVAITAGSGQNPPVITTPAAAMQSPVKARSTTVTVGANDDGTEANLQYTWTATGPAPVQFSPNGSNAAKSSTATFSKEGSYTMTVTVRDGTNKTATGSFTLPVESQYSVLRLTPTAVQLTSGATQQFSASPRDQFDLPIASPPTLTWQVPAGGGTITSSGLFKAQTCSSASGCGPFAVIVFGGGISTSASVGIGKAPGSSGDTVPPTVSIIAPTMSGTELVAGTTVFEALASDDVSIAEVGFEVGQVRVATVTQAPWKTTYTPVVGVPPGRQNLEAVAKDTSGNVTRSSALAVNVPGTASSGGGSGSGTGGGSGSSTGGGSGTSTGGGTGTSSAGGGTSTASGGGTMTSSGGGTTGGGGGCYCSEAGALAPLLGAGLWLLRRRRR